MNFLAIAQRMKREADISGTLSGVANQTGELRRAVEWCASAYDEICRKHPNWKFLRSSFTFNTVASDNDYAPTEVTDSVVSAPIVADEFGYWMLDTFRIYLQAAGVGTQGRLSFMEYDDFREVHLMGTVQTGHPGHFTIRPRDSAIQPGPSPSDVYVVTGDYQKVAEVLAADGDIPSMPARFHMAIVWRAVQMYAGFEEDSGLYDHAGREFNKVMLPLEMDQLPMFQLAGPLC